MSGNTIKRGPGRPKAVKQEIESMEGNYEAAEAAVMRSDKNLRPTIKDGGTPDNKLGRRKIGYSKRIDIEIYEDKYIPEGKKLLVVNDLDGDLYFWADQGAEPVPTMAGTNRRKIEGWLDQASTQWVTGHAGVDDKGNPYKWHLLMIDADLYDEIKLAPQRERQEEIRKAMRMGVNQSDIEAQTYAPNNPDGTQGFNEIRPVVPDVNKLKGI